MKIFTIGFTQKSAQHFFSTLKGASIRTVVDVRLNNRSQLAGFSKAQDLAYFLKEIGGIEYRHHIEMAPTQELLDRYKKQDKDWSSYESDFLKLIEDRQIDRGIMATDFDRACLLCSEHEPRHCHRRLVAEYLASKWSPATITHLL
jgi:uncharacterized protein (DUF488 family)